MNFCLIDWVHKIWLWYFSISLSLLYVFPHNNRWTEVGIGSICLCVSILFHFSLIQFSSLEQDKHACMFVFRHWIDWEIQVLLFAGIHICLMHARTCVRSFVFSFSSSRFQWQEYRMVCFILLIHEGSHREVYQEFQPSYDIFHRSGANGCSDHRFRAPLSYTAQLLTLHQHRANNQYRTANQI